MTPKNDSSIDNLIQVLSKEPKVTQRKSSFKKMIFSLSTFLLCMIAVISFSSIRDDIYLKLTDFNFLIQLILLFLFGSVSAVSAYISSIPGLRDNNCKKLMIVNFLLIILFTGFLILSKESFSVHLGLSCTKGVIMFGLIPSIILYLIINSMASLNRLKTMFYILLSALSYGAIGAQLSCSNDDPMHVFIWHFLPIILLSCVGGVLAHRLIRKT